MKLETTEAVEFIQHFLPFFCSSNELWLNWSLGKGEEPERTAVQPPNDGRLEHILDVEGKMTVACKGGRRNRLKMRLSGIAKCYCSRN
ncbi:hypothetical protein TNCV_5060921 [Trichonephila clavipes]|uniref:Uncharacterized protein n=2 Tax=Trichonephila TaxID=2585208 RepID=A0A8X6KBH1_TRICU|nr:hypothetical protein TNCT_105981 [Trichonephila clavata]GFV03551.1 hypothetical protein TNCV_5060921 [Trichonephila clavipes]GFY72736.1 hypothetical protein TNIN_174321 [Trichonephila inaurata madagascariensis]